MPTGIRGRGGLQRWRTCTRPQSLLIVARSARLSNTQCISYPIYAQCPLHSCSVAVLRVCCRRPVFITPEALQVRVARSARLRCFLPAQQGRKAVVLRSHTHVRVRPGDSKTLSVAGLSEAGQLSCGVHRRGSFLCNADKHSRS